ncbi:MFS transporter [Vibrio rotiferianus]|uniref:MFS transporter n=1 Tax=Vibrio rotiferianus TaxID=190895 RepID=UPI002893C038|nr:Muropeptide transporter [Vibrio rotiferianus]
MKPMVSAQGIKIKPLLAVLASVYTIQSLVSMFTLQGLPAIMRHEGIDTSQIGLFYLAMLPWVAKFLWSPWIERQRKKGASLQNHAIIIFGSQLVLIAILVALCVIGTIENRMTLFAGVLVISLFSSFADIATDGLAIDQLEAKRRYLGNVMQVGGSYLGAVFGGGLFIYATSLLDWQAALFGLALLTLLFSMPTLCLFWNHGANQKSAPTAPTPSLKAAFSNPEVRIGLLLVTVSQLGTRGALSMMMPFLVDSGIQLESLGLLVAGGGVITGLIGVVLGGWLIKKSLALNVLLLMMVFEVVFFSFYLAYDLNIAEQGWLIAGIFIVNGIITSAKFVALYTLMMGFASGHQSGVNFSLFQSMDMFIAIVMAIICGTLIGAFGYSVHFMLMIAFSLIAIFIIPVLKPNEKASLISQI